MLNRGLIVKSVREQWVTTLVFGIALMLICGLLAFALPRFQQQIMWKAQQFPMLQNVRNVMLGTDVGLSTGPEVPMGIAWSHPVVLALLWAHAIICCTRVPAGEIDRGTIDVLLGLPVSRWKVYVSETVVWIGSAVVVLLMALLGSSLGSRLAPEDLRAELGKTVVALVNLGFLYGVVGAFAWMMSSLSDRRGRAVTAVLIVVLLSFLLNYLALFWDPAKRVAFLSILNYYRPVFPLRDGLWPWRDMGVLAGLVAVFWTVGGLVFARRDLSTL